MAKKLSEILSSSYFECDNYACICKKDMINTTPGMPPSVTLKLCSDINQPLHFSYMAQKGLNLSGNAGGPIQTNVLGKLLAIKDDDIDAHIDFFQKYGFLFPIAADEYETIEAPKIIAYVNRIKATLILMNAIAGTRNYHNMLIMAAYLLYSEPVEFELTNRKVTSYSHDFTQGLQTYNLFPDMNGNAEVYSTGGFSVADTIVGGNNKVDISFFNAIRSGTGTQDISGSNSAWFKNLFAMYTGLTGADAPLREIIDFFYHFQLECGIIKEVPFKHIKYYSKNKDFEFSDAMKVSLLNISKYLICQEINYNISTIHPSVSFGSLEPEWRMDSLIEAIYFSIFYMKPGVEIYRECQNPTCKKDVFFLINATAENKKYCCPACANAAAQRRARARKLNK